MAWKDIIKQGPFDIDVDEMLDFMNVTPRMKARAERMKTPEMQKLKKVNREIEYQLDKYSEAADGIYNIINPLHNLGVLKEEDILSFTKVIDELEKKIKDANSEIERKLKGE